MNNLPKVVAQQRRGRASNPRLLDRKSDALPLSHRATQVTVTSHFVSTVELSHLLVVILNSWAEQRPRVTGNYGPTSAQRTYSTSTISSLISLLPVTPVAVKLSRLTWLSSPSLAAAIHVSLHAIVNIAVLPQTRVDSSLNDTVTGTVNSGDLCCNIVSYNPRLFIPPQWTLCNYTMFHAIQA